MTENLKRCPFCDSEARIRSEFGDYCVKCDNCGAVTVYYTTENKAVTAWNNRPIGDELTGKIEKLEAENKRLREALEKVKTHAGLSISPCRTDVAFSLIYETCVTALDCEEDIENAELV